MRAMWFARVTARAVGTRARDYFGSANPPLKKLRADIVCVHALLCGMGRHLSVRRCGGYGAMLSATGAGVAAEARAQKSTASIARLVRVHVLTAPLGMWG